MRRAICWLLWMSLLGWAWGQQTSNLTAVPTVIRFSGSLADAKSKPMSGVVGVTFSLYKDQRGGAPLWMETQNLQADGSGHYSVTLGSTSSQGLPQEIFTSGEARWLGVQPQGQAEQPRVLLMSVPYAMKALDAETIGGRPASSFMLAPAVSGSSAKDDALPAANITGSGTANFVPVFTGTTTIGNSKMYETAGGNVGINTTTPAATLDVKGKGDVRDTLTLFPKGTHPTLSVHGTALSVSNTGVVTFVSGQSFPGTGTVSSVGLTAPGSDFTVSGSPITSSGTLGLSWTVAPTNANTANAIVKRDGSGNFSGGLVTAIAMNAADITLSDALAVSSNAGVPLSVTANFTGATAIQGNASATSGPGWGVQGVTGSGESDAYGVFGYAPGVGSSLSKGVYGQALGDLGTGVFGQFGPTLSGVGLNFGGGAGAWGDAETYGVVGTTDYGNAGLFINNSVSYTIDALNLDPGGNLFAAGNIAGAYCTVDSGGNLNCTGAKNAVVPIDGGKRVVAMSAIESPPELVRGRGLG